MNRKNVAVGLIGGAVVGLVGWYLFLRPAVVITNTGELPASGVRVETDVGESHVVGTIAASTSSRLHVSGRDMAVWVVADLPGAGRRESERIYLTSGMSLDCSITREAVRCVYAR